jgi:hypothetical protein
MAALDHCEFDIDKLAIYEKHDCQYGKMEKWRQSDRWNCIMRE